MHHNCPVCGGDHGRDFCPGPVNHQSVQPACGCGETHSPAEDGPPEADDEGPPRPAGLQGETCGCGHEHHYEQHDEHHDENHDDSGGHCGCGGACSGYDPADLSGVAASSAGRAVYRIENMDCPMEEALIRGKLEPMAGVKALEFNLIKRVLTVVHELDSLEGVEAALKSIDMQPIAIKADKADEEFEARTPWLRLALGGLLALGAEAAHFAEAWPGLALMLALGAIALGGLSTYKKGWIALRNFNLNMNALMSFAVTGAMLIGQWPEAAMVMVLFNVAEGLEAKSLARARAAIGGLLKLTPEKITLRQADGSWADVEAESAAVGALARVKPGQRIALDGRVISGSSAVNQAAITGESLPVEKGPGDQVFAGTVNESGSFEYEVTGTFENTTLARIIRAVEEAQSTRAPIQRFVDRFARIYTPVVFVLAAAVAVLPPLLGGGDWFSWIYKGLVLLVIACPCALVISTPVTIVSGLAAATRLGLLVKGGAFLEEGRKLNWLLLDKTGTITSGRPSRTDSVIYDPGPEVGRAALALTGRSDHPVSRAVFEAAAREDASEPAEVLNFHALGGRGVGGEIEGRQWFLGNRKLIGEQGHLTPELEAVINKLENEGKTVVGLIGARGVAALYAVADTVKPGAAGVIAELKALGLKVMMLTGDNQSAALSVGRAVGVDEIRAELLPEDKSTIVGELSARGHKVGMAGDGINDAPALARADIGFAMAAAGTDAAIETADVAIMDDDLAKLPAFIRLSRATRRILVQNISLAVGIKLVFFILTFTGQTTMWLAVFADIGVSLMVVANGLRMLGKGSRG